LIIYATFQNLKLIENASFCLKDLLKGFFHFPQILNPKVLSVNFYWFSSNNSGNLLFFVAG